MDLGLEQPLDVRLLEASAPTVEVRDLVSAYKLSGSRSARAVDGVSFSIHPGQTLGIVGESGSGKSTLARTVGGFKKPASGQVIFEGEDLERANRRRARSLRTRMQLIVQDPYGALDPRMRIGSILAEPMRLAKVGTRGSRRNRSAELLDEVGLPRRLLNAYPRQLSGGQCQRVGIARALAVNPQLLICDEVVSALDVSVQAHILNLLTRVQTEFTFGMMFISHDVSVILHMSDVVGVMYAGKLVEIGKGHEFRQRPLHPYAQALTATAFTTRGNAVLLAGEPASPVSPPTGCRFHPRCPLYERLGKPSICEESEPALVAEGRSHDVACHFASSDT